MKKYLIFIISVIFLILILSSCFFIQKPTLEAPILLMPPNGTITSTNVTLSWEEQGYPQSLEYKIFFGTNSNPQYVTITYWISMIHSNILNSFKNIPNMKHRLEIIEGNWHDQIELTLKFFEWIQFRVDLPQTPRHGLLKEKKVQKISCRIKDAS